eukprot:PhF_6_TR42222/c0_g1_i1/m.63858
MPSKNKSTITLVSRENSCVQYRVCPANVPSHWSPIQFINGAMLLKKTKPCSTKLRQWNPKKTTREIAFPSKIFPRRRQIFLHVVKRNVRNISAKNSIFCTCPRY